MSEKPISPLRRVEPAGNLGRCTRAGGLQHHPMSGRYSLPACCGNGSVKRGVISRQPIAHCNHAAQHGRRDIALAQRMATAA